jgi:hypothetical protein
MFRLAIKPIAAAVGRQSAIITRPLIVRLQSARFSENITVRKPGLLLRFAALPSGYSHTLTRSL